MSLKTFRIAEQEIRIGIRNKWLVLATLVLALFSLTLALLGSTSDAPLNADRLTITVASLASLSVYLIPLMSLLLAYDAISGELERGTLLMTLSCPISRSEFLIGKLIGHTTVLICSIVIGYGTIGTAIVLIYDHTSLGVAAFIRLILTSIFLGLCFLSLGYILSSMSKQSKTAAASSIGIWFLVIVAYDLVLFGLLVTYPDGIFASAVFPYAILLNPADSFRLFNLTALEASDLVGGLAGVTESLPYNPSLALVSMAVFTIISLTVSILLFRRVVP